MSDKIDVEFVREADSAEESETSGDNGSGSEEFNQTVSGPYCMFKNVIEEHMSDADELKPMGDRPGKSWGLNPSQSKAVLMAQNPKRKLVCIQGPPGTGKTHVLAYYLLSLLKDGKQAVVMTPTKEALSNIKKKLEEVLAFRKISVHKNALMDALKFIQETNGTNSANLTKQEIIKEVRVVFGKLDHKFIHFMMSQSNFNPEVCILTEAHQIAYNKPLFPAVLRRMRIVMAGDPEQFIGLQHFDQVHLMEQVLKKKDRFSWIMLDTQYRSQMAISQWSNKHFYGNSLQNASKSPVLHRHFNDTYYSRYRFFEPLVMIDTSFVTEKEERKATYENIIFATSDMNQAQTAHTYSNSAEAEIVIDYFSFLVKLGVKPEIIAIMTPYKGQVDLIRKRSLEREVAIQNIGMVGNYHGQEYDVVIFSMVRSNPALHLGFVSNLRRLNVAITRAKSQFCLVGNSYMLSHNKEEGKKEVIIDLFNYFHQANLRFPPKCALNCKNFSFSDPDFKESNIGFELKEFREHTRDQKMIDLIDRFNEIGPAYNNAHNSVLQPVIQTQPNAKIVFNAPYDIKHTYHIKVINTSARRIGYGIKITNMKRFGVDPSCGMLDPMETVLLAVSCDAFVFGHTNNDYIGIEWTNTPDRGREWFQGDSMVHIKILPIEYNP